MRKLTIAIQVVLLGLAFSANVSATTVEAQLIGTVVDSGSLDGTVGTGTVTFDDGADFDFDITPLNGMLTVEFTIFGQTFTTEDDVSSPDGPFLSFFNSVAEFLDFDVHEFDGDVTTEIVQPGVYGFFTSDIEESMDNGMLVFNTFVEVDTNPVPLPAAFPMALAGLGLLRLFGKKSGR